MDEESLRDYYSCVLNANSLTSIGLPRTLQVYLRVSIFTNLG